MAREIPTTEELERRLKEQETVLEQFYPGQVAELARLLNEKASTVEAKIEYMGRTHSSGKYLIVGLLLDYHRLQWGK